jgi:thiamine kinase-like enzyme
MKTFSNKGIGPIVYETDNQTYRIEEFIKDLIMLSKEKMFIEPLLEKMYKNFAIYTTINKPEYHKNKNIFFKELLNHENTNFVNFTCRKMKDLAYKPLKEFKQKFEEKIAEISEYNLFDNDLNSAQRIEDFKNKIKILEFYFENLENIFFNCMPDEGFFVLSHNDAHLVNIMYTKNMEKLYLFDHEYSCTNFLGFDMANYILESLFFLAEHEFPYYSYIKTGLKSLINENFLEIYKIFFNYFEEINADYFTKNPEHKNFVEFAKTKDYYMRVLGLSSIMWAMFAVIYLNFESTWNKTHYDYFNYAIDRLSIYNEFVRFELGHDFNI